MPVPRRLDRRPPEQDLTRTNERITVPEVRLIDQDGQQVGVLKTPEALRFAQERDLDLVEVAPQARPPVARVLDYSKYKYEQAQKQKQARKHQQQITVREIKFRPKIAQHDYDTKKGHVARFLLHKYKVKITIMFRGREVAHPERGVAILDRLAEELSELGVVEQSPTLDGRNMAMLLAPSKGVLSGSVDALHATANGGASAPEAEPAPAVSVPAAPAAAPVGVAAGSADGAAAIADGAAPAEPDGSAEASTPEEVLADEKPVDAAKAEAKPRKPKETPAKQAKGSAAKGTAATGTAAKESTAKGAAAKESTAKSSKAPASKPARKRTPAPSRAS